MGVVIFLDTETGGLNPETDSLLSIGLIAYETHTDQIVDRQEILVWDDDLNKNPDALAVNGIDVEQHRAAAISRNEAAKRLAGFVLPEWRKARMACHNAPFDVGFVRALLGPRFGDIFQFHPLCTMQMAVWLCHCGQIPVTSVSLASLCDYFGVGQVGAHSALIDARSALEVYRRIVPLVRAA